jgi:aldehyde dehydrogenase (NAD+)
MILRNSGSKIFSNQKHRFKRSWHVAFSSVSSFNPRSFYINGNWVPPSNPDHTTHDVIDPSNGKVGATISLGNQQDSNEAVAAARTAFPVWSSEIPSKERRQLVMDLLQLVTERREELAEMVSLEMGAPIDYSSMYQVGSLIDHGEAFLKAFESFEFEFQLDQNSDALMIREPIGVVGMITPWNWPLNQLALKVLPAMLVGCTMVVKPSENAPLSTMLFAEIVNKAGFPPGVFNLVNGDGVGVGAQLSSHPDIDKISFTGSTRAGAFITKSAADTFKAATLELGGKGAYIVFADAPNLTQAIKRNAKEMFGNTGQSCNAPSRLLVERIVYDEAVEIAKNYTNKVKIRSAHDREYHMGPLANKPQWEQVQRYIQIGMDEGARLVAGGLGIPDGVDSNGFYVKPTVFANVNNQMRIAREEIFGPVISMIPFDNEEEAIDIANDSPYGLMHFVVTSDTQRANRVSRKLRAGMITVNGKYADSLHPFGGIKASGHGREGGLYGLNNYCYVKTVSSWDFDDK